MPATNLADEALEVGALYQVAVNHLVNIYENDDPGARWYEKFQIQGPTFIIVLSNHIGVIVQENASIKYQASTCLVLTTKGLGRIPIGSKDYNSWRYKKLSST